MINVALKSNGQEISKVVFMMHIAIYFLGSNYPSWDYNLCGDASEGNDK